MLLKSVAFLSLFSSLVAAAAKCGEGVGNCPADTPCCSPYGDCGTGAYCLQGCDPIYSTTVDSCNPQPICQSKSYTFDNLDRITNSTEYLGDANAHDWVVSLGNVLPFNDSALLIMPKNSGGTVMASTRSIWYGKVTGTLKTSRGAGVITAFILMSDVKDEIDYEFVGADLKTAQTNYYWEGVLDWHNGGNITGFAGDTYDEFHTYVIDWTPDTVTWSIDGKVGRVLNKNDTFNSTTKKYEFPQTPSRISISVWPGGAPSNPPGTIAWSGGVIDWNSQDIQNYGYDFMTLKQVDVECYSPPAGANVEGDLSYTYISQDLGYEDSVVITNKNTTLASFLATGTNQTIPSSSSSGQSGQQSGAPGGGSAEGSQGSIGNGNSTTGGNSNSSNNGKSGPKSNGLKITVNNIAVALLFPIVAAALM